MACGSIRKDAAGSSLSGWYSRGSISVGGRKYCVPLGQHLIAFLGFLAWGDAHLSSSCSVAVFFMLTLFRDISRSYNEVWACSPGTEIPKTELDPSFVKVQYL